MARRRYLNNQSDEHNARGIELADRGWLDEAIIEFKKAIEIDPQASHAHDNLGTVLAEQGRLTEALFEYIEALKADPDSPTVHHYLASFIAEKGASLAISLYHRAIELEPDFPDAHLNLGLTLAELGSMPEALAELKIAHAQAPEEETIEHELARCLIDLERYPEAIVHLKNILKNNSEKVEAWVDMGTAFTAQGFLAEAENALKKALIVDQHDFSAHYHLAALYSTWGRLPEALDHIEVASRHDHEKTRFWLKNDPLFDPIRHEERFVKLLA